MRVILLFISTCLFGLLLVSFETNNPNYVQKDNFDFLYRILPDSLYGQFEKKQAILYTRGHHGYEWSILIKDGDKIRALSGWVNASGKKYLYPEIEPNLIDSSAFISANRDLILWGLDTLPAKAIDMEPVERTFYMTIYTSLSVVNSNGKTAFEAHDITSFNGPDSMIFNSRYNKLEILMFWLAKPFFRPYTEDSIFVIHSKQF